MVNTPNHNYNAPEKGTSDWQIPLNENFKQLDVEVEIRGSEADKADYEPQEGSKYEATDSGAVYYGNGDTWVLADRKAGLLESESSVTGEHLKTGDPPNESTAIVAPSVGSAYNGIQGAIDDGFRDIILAEEITEAGITIPRLPRDGAATDRFRLSGVGGGQYQTINDPGTEDYVIRAEPGDHRGVNNRVIIENIFFDRLSSESGIAILGAKNIHDPDGPWNGAGNWMIRDCVSRAGPIVLVGPRNMLINVDVANFSQTPMPVVGKLDNDTGEVIYDKYGGLFRGTTFGMFGGALMTSVEARSAAYIGAGGFSMTGGITFSNRRDKPDGYLSNNLTFIGATRGFLAGGSTEGDVDWGIGIGMEDSGDGPGDALGNCLIGGQSDFTHFNIESTAHNNTIHSSGNVKIRKKASAKTHFKTNGTLEIEDGAWLPHEITHTQPVGEEGEIRLGGERSSPPTPFGLKIHESKPPFPVEATFAVADGTNWDPVGNGSAALMAYDTDGSWKPVFEYSGSL